MNENHISSANKDYAGIIGQMRKMLDDLQGLCPVGNELESIKSTVDSAPKSSIDTLPGQVEAINTLLADNYDPVPEVSSQLEDDLNEVCVEAAAARDELLKMSIGSNKDRISKMILDNTILSLPTGIKSLDDAIFGGFRPGTIVFGGIPSCGKTTLALQMATKNAEDGCIVIYVSYEMSEAILVAKSIAKGLEQKNRNAGKKPTDPSISAATILLGTKASAGQLIDKEEIRSGIEQFYNTVGDNLIILERKNGMMETATDIRNQIETIVELVRDAYGDKKSVIAYIDYLQIVPSQNNTTNDKVSVDCNMAVFQSMANELEIPVVIISSLGRASYTKQISIDSFKESGSIEYSADTLIGLEYQGVGEKNFDVEVAKNMNPRKVELVILKQRTGSAGQKVPLDYYPEADLFVDPNSLLNPSATTDSSDEDDFDDDFDF